MFDIFSPENIIFKNTFFFCLNIFSAHIGPVYLFILNSVSLRICQCLKRDNLGNDCSGRVNPDRRSLRDVSICSDPQESHTSLLFSILFLSVADPGCLSRIPDSDFYLSLI
jgi:hypothetical protein